MKIEASYHQERLWFIDQFESDNLYESSPVYHNIPLILEITGTLDLKILEQGIQAVINRHEALRTQIITIDNRPLQFINENTDFKLVVLDLDHNGDAKDSDSAMVLALEEVKRPFLLDREFLIRAKLIQTDKAESLLVIIVHHIIADKFSLEILADEILLHYEALLNNRLPRLPELSIHFADFSQWQREFPDEISESFILYWKMKLHGKLQPLEIPVDRPRAPVHIYQDARQSFSLSGKIVEKIKTFSEKEGVDRFIVLLAAFKVLLYRYAGQDDIVVGTALKNRNEPGTGRIIGPISNLVVLNSSFSRNSTFSGLLQDLGKTVRDAYKYQALPFDKLVSQLNPHKDMSRTAIFDVLFQYEENPLQTIDLQNLKVRIIETNLGWGKYDLNVLLQQRGETISGILVYNAVYYDDWRISRLIDHYIMVLRGVLEEANRELSKIRLLTEEEKKQLLVDFNQTEAGYPKDKTIHRLFAEQAERTPLSVALIGEKLQITNNKQPGTRQTGLSGPGDNVSLTYKELNQRSNQLAWVLREKGVEPDTIVGIMLDRTVEVIIGFLAILKAGGAYLPIDPDYPEERIQYMLRDSNARILLKKSEIRISKSETNSNDRNSNDQKKADSYNVLDFETLNFEFASNFEFRASNLNPSSLAYIIYTSGTTGKPKGVLIQHRSVVRLFFNDKFQFDFSHHDTWTLFHSFCFDFSVWEMYGALLYGGRLIVISRMTARDTPGFLGLLRTEGATVLNQTPSAFYRLLDEELQQETTNLRLRYVIFGGEALSPGKLKKWRDRYPDTRLINMFGITETTVHVTYKEITAKEIDLNFSNIGKPIPTLTSYVMDENQQLSPPGLNNELYIGGAGVARGYLNRPQLTKERFIENPYKKGESLYRSGDLVRFLENGDMLYSGRIDHQVQLRGFRVEMGEIEKQVLRCTGVREVVVVDKEDESGDKYLCAYITADEAVEPADIRSKLAAALPDYMIPSYFVKIDRIPLTANGKIDRPALPEPGFKAAAQDHTVPLDEVQQKLQEIWSGVLNIEKENIGINTSFFEMGGHSLKATILVSRIHKTLNINLPLAQIFTTPTIKELSGYIRQAKEERFVSIEPVKEKEYYKLSSAQKRFYILQQIGGNNTAYNMFQGFPLSKEVDKEKLAAVFNRLTARHETLRTSFQVVEGEPVQKIHDKIQLNLQQYKTDEIGLNDVIESFTGPFDLSKAPLLRVGLVEIQSLNPYCYLLVEMHHIISDEVSQTLLQKEFMALSRGQELPPLRLQYKDFAEWENSRIHQEAVKKQETFWLKQFDGEFPVLDLPLDFPRPPVQGYAGCTVSFYLPLKDSTALRTIARQEGATIFMVLLTVFNLFLTKICSQEDIIIGTPVAGRKHLDLEKIIGVFINSLALRNFPTGEKTVKEFLNQVRINTLEAFENQQYPFEDLVEKVMKERDASRNPIFDVMLNLLTREDYLDTIPAAGDEDVNSYTHIKGRVRFDMNVVAVDLGERIFCVFFYCTALFKPETIERFIGYFKKIVSQLPGNLDRRTAEIYILSEAEKQQLLLEFNAYAADYPRDKAIVQLFQEQVCRTSDNVALVFEDTRVTYRQLNEQANRLGRLLRSKGAAPDTFVSLMVQRSVEMVVGIWGILKSGGAYLPVSPEAPADRITYMLDNASVNILLTQETFIEKFASQYQVINLNSPDSYQGSGANPGYKNVPTDLAYVIYTSGSTGRPKGVMIQNRSVINIVKWFAAQYALQPGFQLLQMFEYTFDASINQIFGSLLHGVTLHVIRKEYFFDIEFLRDYIISRFINLINFVQSVIKEVLCGRKKIESLKHVISGAEKLKSTIKNEILDNGYTLYNQYGPTEVTVDALAEKCSYESNGTVGVPVYNAQCYIVNAHGRLNPVGTAGELWVGGDGLARGYINNVELTAEKFTSTPFIPGIKVYRTGDLTRWLPRGNVEFLGRTDTQIKIRGFRIEPVEIANQLVKIHGIKEAVVIDREDSVGETYLCAYLVEEEKTDRPENSEIKNILSRYLPDYMIPSYYVWIPRLPLSGHGKLIRSALPEPDMAVSSNRNYAAPTNELEKKLVEIWSGVLNVDPQLIGIISDFFELGGHSLKATILVSRLHKELNVKIPLAEVFVNPTIQEMEQVIIGLTENKFEALKAMEKKEYYVLSPAQKRLYFLQQMDTESIAYNLPHILPMGDIDKKRLEDTFKKLVSRHESFRTSFEMLDEVLFQKVHGHDHIQLLINYYTVESQYENDGKIAGIINKFVIPFDLSQAPLLRIGLIEIEDKECVLLVDVHHILTDGTSYSILIKEFLALYAGKELPNLRIQYKDYSEWQEQQLQRETFMQQEKYWLTEFQGEIPVLNMPTDYLRPAVQSFEGSNLSFEIGIQEARGLQKIALEEEATLFMVILAIFNVLLSKLSGQEEIIIGTPIASRRHADLEKIIGMFVSTLALKNYPEGYLTFKEFLEDMKERVLMAFENQEYPFEELVDKLSLKRDIGRNPLFDIMFVLENMNTGLAGQDKKIKIETGQSIEADSPQEYENIFQTARFDLTLTAMERDRMLFLSLQYCTKLFKKETVERFIIYFKKIVAIIVKEPGIKLSEIIIISEEEKNRILNDFNKTEVEYPRDKTIHRLFEEQVERRPDNIAIIGPSALAIHEAPLQITYKELYEKSNQLACELQANGVTPDTIVGIMGERSVQMIIGIMGILKSGGAYLPIDPEYPKDRIEYILKDSRAKILLAAPDLKSAVEPSLSTLTYQVSPANLAYIIYTSGSTGRPKGVMVQHRSLVNACVWQSSYYNINERDHTTQYAPFVFDASLLEIFPCLIQGASLYIIAEEIKPDAYYLNHYYEKMDITFSFLPTQFCELFMELENHSLRVLLAAGDMLRKFVKRNYRLYNNYGPTENTVVATSKLVETQSQSIPIGTPIHNNHVYILDKKRMQLQPIGVPGELCIGGESLSRGYLNHPELTAEKFDHDLWDYRGYRGYRDEKSKNKGPGKKNYMSHRSHRSYRSYIYRTGDLARWLPKGDIEFLGRIDTQVKVRGYRIELGEIERCLLNIRGVKLAVVVVREELRDEKSICAYFVSDKKYGISELREYLSTKLPDYMIPAHFVPLDKIPLTPNGKVDHKALPEPKKETGLEYEAPRNKVEEKLVAIWSDILRFDKSTFGINDNFFVLGGHSLRATRMAARIHKEFHVKFPLTELFKTPIIRGMAEYIKGAMKEEVVALESLEKKEYHPVSSQQKRLFMLQQRYLNLKAYNMIHAYISKMELDKEKLKVTFRKLIQRHESLRTSFDVIGDGPIQKVHNNVPFTIEYYDGDFTRESTENFVRPFDLSQAPLLRVGIINPGDGKNILMVDIHHIISDGISNTILISDFMALYEGKQLPAPKFRYKDFSHWQSRLLESGEMKKQEKYWLETFAGEIPKLAIPRDYADSKERSFEGGAIYVEFDDITTRHLNELANQEGATLFILLLACYNVLLVKLSGQEDIVVGTGTAGRRHTDLEKIIGMFINTLALRNYPAEEKTFKDFLSEVKERTLLAFENQDYFFENLVEKVVTKSDPGRNPLFDTSLLVQNLESETVNTGKPEQPELELSQYGIDTKRSIFDIAVFCGEIGGKLGITVSYSTSIFKKETIEKYFGYYKDILSFVIENKELTFKLKDICLTSGIKTIESKLIQNETGDFGF